MDKQQLTRQIKAQARELGFDFVGVSKAGYLEEEAPKLEKWLREGQHGQMNWMEQHFDKRLDPRKLVGGAKSVISVLLNYYPEEKQREDSYKISKYAYGRDYHKVMKKKLKNLSKYIVGEVGDINLRCFVDSAPVMDKAWAERSGIGWIGKNTNLIHPKAGSFFFVGEIVLDLELEYDGPIKDYCGTCRKCIDACPTDAIEEPYVVNGSKCISYYTIELKDAIPESEKGNFNDWMFGCDICQDVCPWNSKSAPHNEPDFMPKEETMNYSKEDWEELTEEIFKELFYGTPVKRTQYKGLKRNINFVKDQ